MTIKERKWKDAAGRVRSTWVVDVQVWVPGKGTIRVRRASPINTRRAAELYENQVRASILNGTLTAEVEAPAKAITFADFLPRYLTYSKNNNKFSTYESKLVTLKNHLEPFFGSLALEAIGPAEVEAFKEAMQDKQSGAHRMKEGASRSAVLRRYGTAKQLSKKTINNALAVLSKLLTLAEEYKVLAHAPSMKFFKVGKPEFDFLTFEEHDRLIAAAEPEWRAALLLATKAGLRSGELRALQWGDVDLVRGLLIVRRNFWKGHLNETPKGGRSRTVDLPGSLVHELKAVRHLKAKWVVAGDGGKPYSQKRLDRPLAYALKRAGIAREEGRIGWHDLRHTYGSHLAMRGVPLKTIQELMGHASIEQTMRYAHLSPEVKREAVKALDAPTPGEVAAQARHMVDSGGKTRE